MNLARDTQGSSVVGGEECERDLEYQPKVKAVAVNEKIRESFQNGCNNAT